MKSANKTKLIYSVVVVIGFFQINAHAAATHYQDLKQLFAQAQRASLSDLEASYAGRCFYNRALADEGYGGIAGEDDPAGSILIGRLIANPPIDPSQDAGPLFPPAAQIATPYVIAEVSTGAQYQVGGSHYRFDDWTDYQAQQMLDYSITVGEQIFPVVDSGQDLNWHEDYNRGAGPHINNTLRRSGDYLVLHGMEVAQGSEAPPHIDFYCYFYKKLN